MRIGRASPSYFAFVDCVPPLMDGLLARVPPPLPPFRAADFSNIIPDGALQELAEADEHEVVKQVQEYFADFLAVDAAHFTLDVPAPHFAFLPMAKDSQVGRRVGAEANAHSMLDLGGAEAREEPHSRVGGQVPSLPTAGGRACDAAQPFPCFCGVVARERVRDPALAGGAPSSGLLSRMHILPFFSSPPPSCPPPPPPPFLAPKSSAQLADRIVSGLGAALLSLKKRPLVRYQRSSELARRVGQDVYRLAYQQVRGGGEGPGDRAGSLPCCRLA